jgi:hypothetical protein
MATVGKRCSALLRWVEAKNTWVFYRMGALLGLSYRLCTVPCRMQSMNLEATAMPMHRHTHAHTHIQPTRDKITTLRTHPSSFIRISCIHDSNHPSPFAP